MGVQGLLSTCLENAEQSTESYDLILEAQRRGGLELIVDFYSFQQEIVLKFWKGLSQLRNNPYLRILGGEYATLDAYISKLITDLRSLGIELVFYIDGGKGSSTEGTMQKMDTWVSRHEQDLKRVSDILEVLRGTRSIDDLPWDNNVRPVVLEDQVMSSLKKCECEIHQSAAGEADMLVIRALKERPKAFAILSNDSDFCVFRDSRLIPNKFFDMGNNLRLGCPQELPEKPSQLLVKVITTEKVMSMLKLNQHYLLVEMGIVAGNDFTGPFMRGGLHSQLDVRGRRCVQNFAGWIRHYRNVDKHPFLCDHMQRDPNFRQAVYHSRNFYNERGTPDAPPRKGFYSQVIEENIHSGKFPTNLMSMHNNFYWYRMLLEDTSPGAPSVECALTQLRAYVYRIVLPRHEQIVNEYGRSPYESFRKAEINAIDDGKAPPLHKIQSDKIFNNLRTFHQIMSCQERGPEAVNWFDRYGRKNGFIVYILRFFIVLNWGRNLHITDNEFLALVAMMFGRQKESHYQSMAICPTVRCVTIGNWMQDLYRHAHLMLGSVLHVRHEFPLPSELFSGSVWTAMYMVAQDETFRQAARQVPVEMLYQTQQEMNAVIKEKKHMIRHIVEQFFPFED
ncbi:uncharacterized protein LOC127841801 [Dreissena polymorpha]|uniref:Uncharacterized protein n=1 Tax=Dreissena polymorpha TaxID=45954 RepID=A0A9D4IME1_DREPO|nr:uncharacterized protein LOC127841801 [Dreissena polymorpha]XP_052226839.1 uncharacterized protein LOC127841801 [Dreissena polymorpha]XP_052226840.1 uncharacterized protein LOC127841801 [Dreissena polymorpha]XP_052226841.1 uncharacterized protein LOC127841801 [Dreissena polymorpha]XP_052226842.1 uncharacterized protein LOC127841801 [Dreissena polymorpha]XP_052226843.1 uncharacterized protein LOC127841801 [Dreissena polymorpha]XP_052226844.1 uncharacterized protein LOC127841801 [Dreissena po